MMEGKFPSMYFANREEVDLNNRKTATFADETRNTMTSNIDKYHSKSLIRRYFVVQISSYMVVNYKINDQLHTN